MVNAMNREGCIDTGSNPVLATKKQNKTKHGKESIRDFRIGA